MRLKKIPALALVVTAAGLSLTACNGSKGSSAAADSSAPVAASSSTGGQSPTSDSSASGSSTGSASGSANGSANGSSTGSGTGSGTGGRSAVPIPSRASGAMCRTDALGFSAASAGVTNEIVVNLKNTGSGTCSMHGFPGVQLVGPDGLGDTGPDAARTDASASTVTLAPGEETRFLLRYLPDTSGSGKTYTRLSVTPPNETVSEIVNLGHQDITVPASGGNAPDVYVDPVGYHVGFGK
ncbi:DUF4232 domain-containing protein [Streptomyces sp. NPDC020917]|uniref:DUF4232 domain-containing protein n=1 Tax=Streptomyces sp. NPDC020917 TaxID=3365102 RepID=UPI0037BB3B81